MAWRQTLSPNLDNDPNNPLFIWNGGSILTDWYGWCLAVVAGSYGARGSSYSAKTAWQANSTKHWDRNIPEGIYVPLWYEGGDYGHVVIGFRQGNWLSIWSSPYTHIATFQYFEGDLNWLLDYIGQVYAVGSFSGWSETVLDSRVIEQYTESKPEPTPEPEPAPEPTPEPEPGEDNNGKDEDMTTEPTHEDQQLVGGIIEDVDSDWFEPSKTTKLIAYLVGDFLLASALIVPDLFSCFSAPTPEIFAEYLSKVLLEAGTCILMIFKLIKKKS